MLDVLREEKKYEMSLEEITYVKGQLEQLMHGDAFNGTDPYLVRSLYFDSASDIDFYEKESGVNDRKKIRLRIYTPDASKAKLELKAKSGSMQRKQSLTVSREEAKELIEGNYEVLLSHEEELAGYLYRKMTMELYQPRCVVEYDRIAFGINENNVRLTLDSGVRSNEGNFDIFSKDLQLYPVMSPTRSVLEVKYNHFLPSYIKDIIQCVDKIETSVSKYVLARRFSLGGEG
ncbi:MAG: polyphosphate polymerase domain-containing protein [Roseburia sp.]